MLMSSQRRSYHCVLVLFVVAMLNLLPSRSARADDSAVLASTVYAVAVGTVGLGIVGGNLAFTIHDAVTAGDSKPAATRWTLGETLFTSPQAIYCNGVLAWAHGSSTVDEAPRLNLMILPAIWTTQMATHGIWSLALEQEKPAHLYGFSWAIGANLTFTSGALGAAFGKRLGGTIFGLSEMAGTAPTIVVGLLQLEKDALPERLSWTVLTAWSGALFLHGATSTVVGLTSRKKPATNEPQSEKSAFRFTLTPTLLPEGRRNVPGIVAGGVF